MEALTLKKIQLGLMPTIRAYFDKKDAQCFSEAFEMAKIGEWCQIFKTCMFDDLISKKFYQQLHRRCEHLFLQA